MVSGSSRARSVQKFAICLLMALATAQAALAVPNFTPQQRVGYTTGDQWEPAMATDGHGHIYILFPQYGAVSNCPACTAPTMALLVSNDNGLSWQAPHALVASSTGQFDPQIVVDPVDRQTVYASWLQNNKRDVMVAQVAGLWAGPGTSRSRSTRAATKMRTSPCWRCTAQMSTWDLITSRRSRSPHRMIMRRIFLRRR